MIRKQASDGLNPRISDPAHPCEERPCTGYLGGTESASEIGHSAPVCFKLAKIGQQPGSRIIGRRLIAAQASASLSVSSSCAEEGAENSVFSPSAYACIWRGV